MQLALLLPYGVFAVTLDVCICSEPTADVIAKHHVPTAGMAQADMILLTLSL